MPDTKAREGSYIDIRSLPQETLVKMFVLYREAYERQKQCGNNILEHLSDHGRDWDPDAVLQFSQMRLSVDICLYQDIQDVLAGIDGLNK